MGVYDSVMIPCPECGHREEFQSKGADFPLLRFYKFGEDWIPHPILDGLHDSEQAVCGGCGERFAIRVRRTLPEVTTIRLDEGSGDASPE